MFARGLLDRVVTRIYFPDEAEANAADPVLPSITDPARRATLVATADPAERPARAVRATVQVRHRHRLQGEGETVFFDV